MILLTENFLEKLLTSKTLPIDYIYIYFLNSYCKIYRAFIHFRKYHTLSYNYHQIYGC